MKKIPTIFKRDKNGKITDEPHLDATWVFRGEGVATVKYDGTCCMIKDGVLYKRYDRKPNKDTRKKRRLTGTVFSLMEFKKEPYGWISSGLADVVLGHWYGWVPVDPNDRADRWHCEAFERTFDIDGGTTLHDKTYELVGPKVQGNPYDLEEHQLWPHGHTFDEYLGQLRGLVGSIDPPREFDGLATFLEGWKVEGIVWWHPDGRMAKIKRVDFGLKWPKRG